MKNELCLADNLALAYGNSRITSLSILIRDGECVEMLGTSSSGKSALKYFLLGKVPVEKGSFWYRGKRFYPGDYFTEMSDVRCMGERPALLEELSVGENLYLFSAGRMKRKGWLINQKKSYTQANFLLARFDTGIRAEQTVRELDPEDKRVLEILLAMVSEVHFLYIDNSFQNFGQRGIRKIFRLLSALKERGTAILFAGEGLARMTGLSDRILVIRRGRIVRCFYESDYTTERFLSWMNGSDITWHQPRHRTAFGRTVLEVRDLCVGKDIRNPDFCLREGETIGFYDMDNVVNHNLCQAILGQLLPEKGRFYHYGQEFIPERESGKWIGWIPNDYDRTGVIPQMTAEDNIALPILQKTQHPLGIVNERVIHYIGRHQGGSFPDTLSSLTPVDALRLVYERWEMARPQVLICEMVINESDDEMFRIHKEYLGKITGNGTAVIIASQNYSEMMVLCDRILVVNQV